MGGRADNEPAGKLPGWRKGGRNSSARSEAPVWAPEVAGGLLLYQPPLCCCFSPARGSRATQSLCSGAEGSLLGVASDVTGHEQRRREVCMGLADIGPEAG